MATTTTKLGLRKPAGTDLVDVTLDISNNMQLIDDFLQVLLPLGTLLPYTGAAAPSADWLIANGAAVSRTTYSDYYALVGNKFGAGDGTTTFNLPNVVDKSLVGAGVVANGATAAIGSHSHGKSGGVSAANAAHSHGGADGNAGPDHVHGVNGSTGIQNADHDHAYYNALGPNNFSTSVQQANHGHGIGFNSGGATAFTHQHSIGNDNANHAHGDTIAYAAATTENALGLPFIVKVKK